VIRQLTERGFGKAPQAVELTDADGEPIVIHLRWQDGDEPVGGARR